MKNYKQKLEDLQAKITSLEKANEDIINQNEVTQAEIELLESETRKEQIKSILFATTLSNEEIERQLEVLPRSGLSIEFIASTYEPITKKKYIKREFSTKLPQKNTIRNDASFIT